MNRDGELPPGIHIARWTEIEERFGKGTPARRQALVALKRIHAIATRTGFLRNFYVFGSFVSGVPEPRDVDIVLVMGADFRVEDCPENSGTLFSHADAQSRYGASVFWIREGMLPDASMSEFLRGWQIKRDGTLRGILEIA